MQCIENKTDIRIINESIVLLRSQKSESLLDACTQHVE